MQPSPSFVSPASPPETEDTSPTDNSTDPPEYTRSAVPSAASQATVAPTARVANAMPSAEKKWVRSLGARRGARSGAVTFTAAPPRYGIPQMPIASFGSFIGRSSGLYHCRHA